MPAPENFGELEVGDVFRLTARRDRVLTKISTAQAVDAFGDRVDMLPGWEVVKVMIRRGRGVNADPRATARKLRERAQEALANNARHTFVAPEQLLELIEVAERVAS